MSKSDLVGLLMKRISLLQDRILVTEDEHLKHNLIFDLNNVRDQLSRAIQSYPALDLPQPSEEG